LAFEQAKAAEQDGLEAVLLKSQRESSKQNVIATCMRSGQDPEDPNSLIGKSMAAVFAEMKASDHPDLYEPNAPDLIFVKANLRLAETERVEVRNSGSSPAPVTVVPPAPSSPAAPATPAQPAPSGVLPVSATARSAQPAPINLADLSRITKEMPADELEEALYGKGKSAALLRM